MRDKDEKVRLIYESFSRLVETEGYENTTMRGIAESAGISVGIIYRYFPRGKPAIAAGFYEQVFLKVMEPATVLGGSVEDLRGEIQLHLDSHRRYAATYRAFDQASLEGHDLFSGLKRSMRQLVEERVKDAQGRGDLAGWEPYELVGRYMMVYGLVDALVHRHLFVGPYTETDEELVQTLADLSLTLMSREALRP